MDYLSCSSLIRKRYRRQIRVRYINFNLNDHHHYRRILYHNVTLLLRSKIISIICSKANKLISFQTGGTLPTSCYVRYISICLVHKHKRV